MKKLFISQPMNGLTEEEILKARKEIKQTASKRIDEELKLIDSYFPEYPEDTIKNKGIWYLGKSLMRLSEADIVFFGKGWEDYRGCRLEHEVAKAYGLSIIEE